MNETPVTQSRSPQPHARRCVIVGGGVAGIAAAVRLAEHGVPVTLVETRQRLGGRATSFVDPTTGDVVDNCQHVLMRCCTSLLDLYRRLGVADRIEWHRRLYFADRHGRIDAFESDDLPAPLQFTSSLLRMKTLTWAEKTAIARGMLAILQLGEDANALGHVSFADWLREEGQPQSAIERFWAVVVVSACNEQPENVAAKYALQVFREGFLASEHAYEMGVPGVPLVQLYDAAETRIARAGGRVITSASAERFEFDGHAVAALRLSSGEAIAGDAFVSAVPFDRLAKLSSELMVASDARLRSLMELRVSPIIGVHLYLRRGDGAAAMKLPHLVLMDSPLQWVFNKGRIAEGKHAGAWHLHGVISGAHAWVDRSADEIAAMAVAELRKAAPEAVEARLEHHRVVKEKRATFSVQPGVDRLRPPARGAIANLLLAGDWTDTGWPATMEGAARSGYAAAAGALDYLGVAHGPIEVPDSPASPLYRLMAG